MGTSRPTLYHVIHDEIGFTSDDVQQLTYWVSFHYKNHLKEKCKFFL